MSDTEILPFESHARRFLVRLQNLTRRFRTDPPEVESVLSELDKLWPQFQMAFTWVAANQEVSSAAPELSLGFAACGDPAGGNSPLEVRRNADEAQHWVQVALGASRRLGLRLHEAGFSYQLASVSLANYQLTEARQHGEYALRLFRDANDDRNAAITLNLLGLVAIAGGDVPLAMSWLQESLDAFRSLQLPQDVALTLGILAQACVKAGRFEDALRHATEERTLARENGNLRTELDALRMMAHAYAGLGQHEELIAVCNEAAAFPSDESRMSATWTAGFGLFDLIRVGTAVGTKPFDQLERDLVGFRELKNWTGEGFALACLGLGYAHQGDKVTGIAYLQQALCVFRSHGYEFGTSVIEQHLRGVKVTGGLEGRRDD